MQEAVGESLKRLEKKRLPVDWRQQLKRTLLTKESKKPALEIFGKKFNQQFFWQKYNLEQYIHHPEKISFDVINEDETEESTKCTVKVSFSDSDRKLHLSATFEDQSLVSLEGVGKSRREFLKSLMIGAGGLSLAPVADLFPLQQVTQSLPEVDWNEVASHQVFEGINVFGLERPITSAQELEHIGRESVLGHLSTLLNENKISTEEWELYAQSVPRSAIQREHFEYLAQFFNKDELGVEVLITKSAWDRYAGPDVSRDYVNTILDQSFITSMKNIEEVLNSEQNEQGRLGLWPRSAGNEQAIKDRRLVKIKRIIIVDDSLATGDYAVNNQWTNRIISDLIPHDAFSFFSPDCLDRRYYSPNPENQDSTGTELDSVYVRRHSDIDTFVDHGQVHEMLHTMFGLIDYYWSNFSVNQQVGSSVFSSLFANTVLSNFKEFALQINTTMNNVTAAKLSWAEALMAQAFREGRYSYLGTPPIAHDPIYQHNRNNALNANPLPLPEQQRLNTISHGTFNLGFQKRGKPIYFSGSSRSSYNQELIQVNKNTSFKNSEVGLVYQSLGFSSAQELDQALENHFSNSESPFLVTDQQGKEWVILNYFTVEVHGELKSYFVSQESTNNDVQDNSLVISREDDSYNATIHFVQVQINDLVLDIPIPADVINMYELFSSNDANDITMYIDLLPEIDSYRLQLLYGQQIRLRGDFLTTSELQEIRDENRVREETNIDLMPLAVVTIPVDPNLKFSTGFPENETLLYVLSAEEID